MSNPRTIQDMLQRQFGCSYHEIDRCRTNHHGMAVYYVRDNGYAVGSPGLTENYYGNEIKLSETVSAYRITPEIPQ